MAEPAAAIENPVEKRHLDRLGAAARCGLVVNPIAGMGGRVGLKGTDGPIILAEARRLGAAAHCVSRAVVALERLRREAPDTIVVTGAGALGEDTARSAGLPVEIVSHAPARPRGVTTASDTVALATALEAAGVGLILVAGGDGTVRDVYSAVGDRVPLLGVPAGVKMHSALFAKVPALAGDVAAKTLRDDGAVEIEPAEILDIDEDAVRADRVSTRLFGYGRAPAERRLVQGPKAAAMPADSSLLRGAAAEIAAEMAPGTVYLLGCGTSVRLVADALGIPFTLLGIDAVLDGALVGRDLSEAAILDLLQGRSARAILGVVGGHGCLLGRGNQQLSPAVLRRIELPLIVLAGQDKLARLATRRLFVDTGNAELDRHLAGYLKLRTGPGRFAIVQVEA